MNDQNHVTEAEAYTATGSEHMIEALLLLYAHTRDMLDGIEIRLNKEAENRYEHGAPAFEDIEWLTVRYTEIKEGTFTVESLDSYYGSLGFKKR